MDNYWEVNTPIANPENLKIINEFLLFQKSSNKRPGTIISYRGKLQLFFKETEVHFTDLTFENILQWPTEHQKNWKENTLKNYVNALRAFFSFCVKNGYITDHSFLRKIDANYWELKIRLPNDENQKVINEYLLCLKNVEKDKQETIRIRKSLQNLFKEKSESYSSLTYEDIKEWIKENQGRLKEVTIRNYLYNLRSFYHFCQKEGYLSENPVKYRREKETKYWKVKIPLPNNENKERINEFLLSLHVANYSRSTITSYRYILQYFFKEKKEPYSDISSAEIQQWLIRLRSRCTEGTITYRINVLNSFYGFCVGEGYIERSPMKRRWFPRLPQPVPKYLTTEETAKVRTQSEDDNLRNRTLVEFFLSSGCRVGEVHTLNRSDVDIEKRTARVIGKGQKIRQVHFSVRCGILLERYLQSRNDQNPALFVTNHLNPRRLSLNWMRTILKRIGKKAGLSSSLHPHRLRHTFATDLLEKGAELSFIGDQLGHKHIKTTQIYANLPKLQIKLLYRRYMG